MVQYKAICDYDGEEKWRGGFEMTGLEGDVTRGWKNSAICQYFRDVLRKDRVSKYHRRLVLCQTPRVLVAPPVLTSKGPVAFFGGRVLFA